MMNVPVLDGYFERLNGYRMYSLPPAPPKVIEKFSLENLELMPIEIEQKIKELSDLLKAVQARENAKRGIKSREQLRNEEFSKFIDTFDERHLQVLESIAKRIDPPRRLRKAIADIEFWCCAGTVGSLAKNYRISIRGQYVLEILRKRYTKGTP